MRKLAVLISLLAAAGLMVVAATALADRGGGRGGNNFHANLSGYNETPSESTPGKGTLRVRIVDGDTIHYRLHYEDFEAAEGATTFSHIHFGQRGVAGGVAAFLCGGTGQAACTPTEGTFEGDIEADDIVGPNGQGIAPGEMDEVLRAMRKGFTYGNVHTTLNGPGLIRGQLVRGHGRGGGGDRR